MKIIFGLGNPGREYEKTRHNAGFMMLDAIREKFNFPEFKMEKKFNARIAENMLSEEKIILVKPQTFMNLSGETIRSMLDFFKVFVADILILHDDLDIELGKIKLASDSSAAGHNGVQNIFDTLGTQKMSRLRIGISKSVVDKAACRIGAHDYVLGKFSEEELEKLNGVREKIFMEVAKFINQKNTA